MFVRTDRIHAAGFGAGALELEDRPIRADILAAAAFDAFGLVDYRFAVLNRDRTFGADLLAGIFQTALAGIGHMEFFIRAGVAGEFDNINQRRIVIFFRDCAFIDSLRKRCVFIYRAQRQADCKTQALADDRPLQKDRIPIAGDLPGQDFIGQLINAGIVPALVGKARDLGKDLAPYIGDRRIDTSHTVYLISRQFFWCAANGLYRL